MTRAQVSWGDAIWLRALAQHATVRVDKSIARTAQARYQPTQPLMTRCWPE